MPPTLVNVGNLVARLAESRDYQRAEDTDADAVEAWWARRMQAEKAGRALLLRLITPQLSDFRTPGAAIRSLVETVQLLLHTSTPTMEPRICVTMHYRHVEVSATQAHRLLLIATDLLLRALDGGGRCRAWRVADTAARQ